eukprot:ANDGO_00776.mRNA.1 hypothetical protein
MTKSEREREIEELQAKYVDLNNRVLALRQQQQNYASEKKRRVLTLAEIDPVTDDVVSYRTLGKMFVRDSLSSIKKSYAAKINEYDAESQNLKAVEERVTGQLREVDASLKELARKDRD